MFSTLRGCIRVLRSTVPIVRSFLTFWSFWQGTHSHSLRKHSPGNRLWWEQQSAGGPAWLTGILRPPGVAQWTRLTGKLPNGGWWSDTQRLTLGLLHNKDIVFFYIIVRSFKLLPEILTPRSPPEESTAASRSSDKPPTQGNHRHGRALSSLKPRMGDLGLFCLMFLPFKEALLNVIIILFSKSHANSRGASPETHPFPHEWRKKDKWGTHLS